MLNCLLFLPSHISSGRSLCQYNVSVMGFFSSRGKLSCNNLALIWLRPLRLLSRVKRFHRSRLFFVSFNEQSKTLNIEWNLTSYIFFFETLTTQFLDSVGHKNSIFSLGVRRSLACWYLHLDAHLVDIHNRFSCKLELRLRTSFNLESFFRFCFLNWQNSTRLYVL